MTSVQSTEESRARHILRSDLIQSMSIVVAGKMEIGPAHKILFSIQHMVQLINQDSGNLHSLTVVARIHELAFAPQTQASLEDILVAMQTYLRKVLEVFDAYVKEALDRRFAILQETGDMFLTLDPQQELPHCCWE